MQPQQNKQDSQDGKKEEQPLMCMPNEAIAGIDEQAVGQVRPAKFRPIRKDLSGASKSSPELA